MSGLPPLEALDRLLLVAGPAHGDVLLATPLLAALRRALPDAVIDVLAYQGQTAVLEGNPDPSEVLSASKHPGPREYLRLLRRLYRRYDLAITTKYTDRAVLYAIVAGRTRIAVVPPGRDAWKRWLTDAHVYCDQRETHALLQNAALAATLGLTPGTELTLPSRAEAPAAVAGLLAGEPPGRPLAVLHLNPGLPHKRWTFEGWTALAGLLHEKGFGLVLTGDGSPAERAYLDAAIARLPVRPLCLAGKLHFADLPELLRRASVYIGTDTVASHLAAAAGTPTVVLFGPEPPRVWGPWPRGWRGERAPWAGSGDMRAGNVLLLQTTAGCPTCRQGDCLRRSERRRSCILMQKLEPDHVVSRLDALIAELPRGPSVAVPDGGAPA